MSTGAPSRELLSVSGLAAGYGRRRVLEDISFSARDGEVTAIIGPNGSGKSTLLKALLGLISIYGGRVLYAGEDVTRRPPHYKIGAGIVFLPQGNRVFDELTVRENLQLGGIILPPGQTAERIEEVLPLFPTLSSMLRRPAYTLSGGERQMLAFARALILKPRLLMLDEPSVGLSPKLVGDVLRQTVEIRDRLGCAVLIVEQKVEQVLGIADRVLAMRMGRLEYQGTPNLAREQLKALLL